LVIVDPPPLPFLPRDEAGVRLATPEDHDEFMQLAASYLVELREHGSEIKPTAQSLQLWQHLFYIYTLPCTDANEQPIQNPGAVVVAGDPIHAFSIAGEPPHSMYAVETDFGRVAYGHGTYVHPDYRGRNLSNALRDRMRAELKSRGFDTVIGGVHLKNDAGAASLKHSTFTWYQLLGFERL
jgi:GNAT superfamily N-acetyltransferase